MWGVCMCLFIEYVCVCVCVFMFRVCVCVHVSMYVCMYGVCVYGVCVYVYVCLQTTDKIYQF